MRRRTRADGAGYVKPAPRVNKGTKRSGNPLRLGAVCFAGLSSLLRREMEDLGASFVSAHRIRNYEYVAFELGESDPRNLGSVRLAEDLFVEFGSVQGIHRASDIRSLNSNLGKQRILDAIAYRNVAFRPRSNRKGKRTSYVCFVRQNRDHQVTRKQVARHVETSVSQAFPRWLTRDPADIEFWVLWGNSAHITLRLTDQRFKYRGLAPPQRAAALRPTIAAAMIKLADIRDGQRVLDPMCGSGTVLLEGSSYCANAEFFGSDVSSEAVQMADYRLKGTASLQQCTLEKLEYESGSFNRIVTNLPWGKQLETSRRIYTKGVESLLDWVDDTGKLVLLTSQKDLLESTLARLGTKWSTTRVLVQGTWATIYVVTKV